MGRSAVGGGGGRVERGAGRERWGGTQACSLAEWWRGAGRALGGVKRTVRTASPAACAALPAAAFCGVGGGAASWAVEEPSRLCRLLWMLETLGIWLGIGLGLGLGLELGEGEGEG